MPRRGRASELARALAEPRSFASTCVAARAGPEHGGQGGENRQHTHAEAENAKAPENPFAVPDAEASRREDGRCAYDGEAARAVKPKPIGAHAADHRSVSRQTETLTDLRQVGVIIRL